MVVRHSLVAECDLDIVRHRHCRFRHHPWWGDDDELIVHITQLQQQQQEEGQAWHEL